jgi:seryl-tRNA synthetase
MLEKGFIRSNLELVRERLSGRGGSYPLDALVEADRAWKEILLRIEELRRQRNAASELIGRLKKKGEETSDQQLEVKKISSELKAFEAEGRHLEERLREILHTIPNLPHESVPTGSDETANLEVRRWGAAPKFDFEPLDHVDLGSSLGIRKDRRGAFRTPTG